ncbi:MAG: hypothetical protein DRO87_11645 [Candidatus Thorarchaeota archaeon]|nr:MAG: hypothetical protein DRO87_11645 [Candidatus Thorarchaeota archaeon]
MNDIYLKLLEHLEDDAKLKIPEHWGPIVLDLLDCVTSFCPSIEIKVVEKANERLRMDFDLGGREEFRPQIHEEIYFANWEIKRLEGLEGKDSKMLCGIDNHRCTKCQIITADSVGVKIDGKLYCRACAMEVKPLTLIVHERSDGVHTINGEVMAKPIDFKHMTEQCDWFIKERTTWNDGRVMYVMQYLGSHKLCRALTKEYADLVPSGWYTCKVYGTCSFL